MSVLGKKYIAVNANEKLKFLDPNYFTWHGAGTLTVPGQL